MQITRKTGNPGLLKTLSSLQFGIVILAAIAFVAVIGTLIPQGRSYDFYREHYNTVVFTLITLFRFDRTYGSPVFIGLLGLFGLNLVLCSVIKFPRLLSSILRPDITFESTTLSTMQIHTELEKSCLEDIQKSFSELGFPLRSIDEKRLFGEKGTVGYLGASVVHLSLLVLLIGGTVSLVTGVRGHVVLEKGETATALVLPNGNEIPFGFSLTLDNFDVSFYESHPGRPKSYTSSVTVTKDDGTVFQKDIRVNHPLMLNGFNMYQSSYGLSEPDTPVSAANDTARIEISLKGAPEEMPPITTVDMVRGNEFLVPGFGDSIKVKLAELYRDFRQAGSSISINSPAVKLDILVNDETRWNIFAFKDFPGLNMPVYEDIELAFTMVDIKVDRNAVVQSHITKYYTVIGVVRDRGIPVMGAGAIFMMAGLFLSFYIRPKRVWVLEENGTIHIGARTKGDPDQFRRFIMKAAQIDRNDKKSEKEHEPDN